MQKQERYVISDRQIALAQTKSDDQHMDERYAAAPYGNSSSSNNATEKHAKNISPHDDSSNDNVASSKRRIGVKSYILNENECLEGDESDYYNGTDGDDSSTSYDECSNSQCDDSQCDDSHCHRKVRRSRYEDDVVSGSEYSSDEESTIDYRNRRLRIDDTTSMDGTPMLVQNNSIVGRSDSCFFSCW
mmetsp:Transcript_21063/g.24242  ORF Transcript_21063/g.24242 Transcript_21063/m.24242 type:complete len:188 (+) Transcript_21063:3-566(+)